MMGWLFKGMRFGGYFWVNKRIQLRFKDYNNILSKFRLKD